MILEKLVSYLENTGLVHKTNFVYLYLYNIHI